MKDTRVRVYNSLFVYYWGATVQDIKIIIHHILFN